jgi:hypothetical protein
MRLKGMGQLYYWSARDWLVRWRPRKADDRGHCKLPLGVVLRGCEALHGNRGVRGRREPPERRLQPRLAAPLSAQWRILAFQSSLGPHSSRNASSGEIKLARMAGTTDASSADNPSVTTAVMVIAGL